MAAELYPQTTKCPECNLRDRHAIAQDYYGQFVARLDSMFEWTGLPDTIPDYILERYLKTIGWCGIGYATSNQDPEAGEQLYCFFGGLGDIPNEYYQPTRIIMANPVLGSKSYEIGKECVWAKNDSLAMGLSAMLSRYSHLLAANDISINISQVTSRMPFVLTAETTNDVESAKQYIKDAEDGKLGIIKSSSFNNGVTPQPAGTENSSYIKALVELHQYLKAQFYNDIGIGSNYNMKRERLSEAEANLTTPSLLPLVDEMLKFRERICEEVKALFGVEWHVKLSSAWKLENEKQKLDVELLETENSRDLESADNITPEDEKDGETDEV